MSGMYAVDRKAMPLLAVPFESEAPEVEALLRRAAGRPAGGGGAGDDAASEHGESKLTGRKAVAVVVERRRDPVDGPEDALLLPRHDR